ncbi:hypothetical protein ZTR_04577 [Talaromyces verruculosus]|nr:hypothetical protein ZTR_04577 [Talaromyces verruculosus]
MRPSEHPLGSKLPRATGKPTAFPSPRAFNSLALGPGAPRRFEDYIYSDIPLFSLHVKTFTDGTLVSVTYSHVTGDLLGFAAVVHSWSLILAGKPELVPPFIGLREDGMKGLLDPPTKEKHVLSGKELTGWRLGYWGLRTLYESWSFQLENRMLCIPRNTMERIMVQYRSQIVPENFPEGTGKVPFISEGDALAAIACRINAQSQRLESARNIMTMITLDPRTRAKSAFCQDSVHVQNSITAGFFDCPADEVLVLPLGKLALLSRKAIMTQATEEQLKAYACLAADSVREKSMVVLFGGKDMSLQLVSNWLKANLFEKMDFSPAILKEAPANEPGFQRGHPTYYPWR